MAGYPFKNGVTAYVQTAAVILDPFSGEEDRLDWSAMTETEHPGCALVPRLAEGDEPLMSGRSPVFVGFYIFGPIDMQVTARDRVRIAGEVFEVNGEPVRWVSPFTGTVAGTQVNIKRMEG